MASGTTGLADGTSTARCRFGSARPRFVPVKVPDEKRPWMKIGLETESCHLLFQHGVMDLFGFIEFAAHRGLDGVQLNVIPDHNLHPRWGVLRGNEVDYLARVKDALVRNHLYCEVDTRGTTAEGLAPALRVAHALGAGVVRSYVQYPLGRYDAAFMSSQAAEVRRLVPLLRNYNIRLAFENHEYETSAEMIAFVREVDELSWVGLLCDTGNSMMAWEEPLSAIRAMAPYAFSAHLKDHAVISHAGQPMVCGMPLGRGSLDLDETFRILSQYPSLHINLESCFPYCATFKRPPGTGDADSFRGAFAVVKAPFASTLVSPAQYYYPHEASPEALETLMECQRTELENSIALLKELRTKYGSPPI